MFSDSSTSSPLRKEEAAQDHPILKRKSHNSTNKIAKDADRSKVIKKQKQKKLKSKLRKKTPYDGSSDALEFSPRIPMRDSENNESSMRETFPHVGSEMD